ncbi:MAG: hypothetical protein AABY22_34375 [Nanoarchaeota archaeon]
MKKETCPICKEEIKAPECYWKSYDCCSACIRKAVLEIREDNKVYPLYKGITKGI